MTLVTESHDNIPLDRLDDETLWEKVRDVYLRETPTRDPELKKEIGIVRKAMNGMREGTYARYSITDSLGVGGAGLVFKAWDKSLRTYRALKLARPIEGKEDLIAGLLSEEISRLQEVSHPNVISIFDAGLLDSTAGQLPFYTMTFLRGALAAHKFFATPRRIDELLEFVRGFLAGMAHLHQERLLHLDIKPSNVYVAAGGYAVVADLGGARRLDGDGEELVLITCTTQFAHPALLGITAVSSTGGDDNRRRGKIKRKQLSTSYDLYAMGRTVFDVLRAYDKASPREMAAYTRKYLSLQAARLLDGETKQDERPLGLTHDSLQALKYVSAADASFDLEKLLGRVNLLTEVKELSPSNERVIQVTRGEKTNLTRRLARLIRDPLIRRLGTVSQLGLVRLIYPGATHTRLEHSLGAFSNAAQYITALYNDPINPLFRQLATQENLVATLLAALLHDLGQYQHAHDLDEVERAIFRHETLTASLLKGEHVSLRALTDPFRKRLKDEWGVSAERVLSILDANPDKLSTDIRDRLLHTIISGPLDVDKLDYLVRDGTQCQTVFARGIDRTRLLSTLTVVYARQGKGEQQYFSLGIHEKGRAAAESLAFTRYQMFRAVYWHHAVRAGKAMLQRAAYDWIAPKGRDASKHNDLRWQLYEFILQTADNQAELFDGVTGGLSGTVGETIKPQWSGLAHSDLLALQWLHRRTTDSGKRLLEMLATRRLYKRVFVISASQDAMLWEKIQENISNHERLKEKSEALRRALKSRVDHVIEAAHAATQPFVITGYGQSEDLIATAAQVLGLEGSVLLDVPKGRSREVLRYYPEDLHRGQREEFEESPSLGVSELWKLLSENLHQTAGSIRVFVHPDLDVLRRARIGAKGDSILSSAMLDEELRGLFNANAES